jgi:hypothetical protein
MNESYDYFEIAHENKGVRKKVMPQLVVLTNDAYEKVVVRFQDDVLGFSTPYSKWSEGITLSDEELVKT